MYSILAKNDGIVKFLAESDDDLVTIIDSCKPGSTVEVLEEKIEEDHEAKTHTFIKSPSGQWVIYEGKSDYKAPKNDAKVSEPNPEDSFMGTDKKIKDYQKGISIYQTGLVTGTLLNESVPKGIGYDDNQLTGHYFTANLETPKGAKQYTIVTEGVDRKTVPCDGSLTVRMENMTAETKTGKNIKIKYDTGEEFEFNLGYLALE